MSNDRCQKILWSFFMTEVATFDNIEFIDKSLVHLSFDIKFPISIKVIQNSTVRCLRMISDRYENQLLLNTRHKYTISNLGTCTHLAQFYYTI